MKVGQRCGTFHSCSLSQVGEVTLSRRAFGFPHGFAPRSRFESDFNVVHSRGLLPRRAILEAAVSRTPCLEGLPLRSDRGRVTIARDCISFRLCVSRACSFVRRLLSGKTTIRILGPRSLQSGVGTRVRGVRALCHL